MAGRADKAIVGYGEEAPSEWRGYALEASSAEARSVGDRWKPQCNQPPDSAPKEDIRTGARSAGSASRRNRAPRRGRALCSRPSENRAARRRTENSRPE